MVPFYVKLPYCSGECVNAAKNEASYGHESPKG
jgi:hypothetical protein